MTDYYQGCYIKQGIVPTDEQKMRHLKWFGKPPHIPIVRGIIPYGMIESGGVVYIVGTSSVDGVFKQSIGKYAIVGTDLYFIERVQHDTGRYYSISIYGDFVYVAGMTSEGGFEKACVRKMKRTDLSIVWTYKTYIDINNQSYSAVSSKLSSGFVYAGSYYGAGYGQHFKIDDSDGSESWKFTSDYACFEVGLPKSDNVDFIGSKYGGKRTIVRRERSNGELISASDYNTPYWLVKGFIYGNYYFLSSRNYSYGAEMSTLTRINKNTLDFDWDANFNFVGTTFEAYRNVASYDNIYFYLIGECYVQGTAKYHATLGKIDDDGNIIETLGPIAGLDTWGAIIVRSDYLCIGSWPNDIGNILGYFEFRSKDDLSLIARIGI